MNSLTKFPLLIVLSCCTCTNLFAQFKEAHPTTGKWALVEQDGYLLSDYEYDKIERRSDTCFIVHKDGRKGMVDGMGQVQIPIEWAELQTWLQPFGWQNGFAIVTKNSRQPGGWGMINSKGEIVLPLKFEFCKELFYLDPCIHYP